MNLIEDNFKNSAERLDKPSAYLIRKARHNYGELERAMTLKTVYVGNLSHFTTEEQIHELFLKCGAIDRIIMGLDRNKLTPCGFCFVIYRTEQGSLNAMKFLILKVYRLIWILGSVKEDNLEEVNMVVKHLKKWQLLVGLTMVEMVVGTEGVAEADSEVGLEVVTEDEVVVLGVDLEVEEVAEVVVVVLVVVNLQFIYLQKILHLMRQPHSIHWQT